MNWYDAGPLPIYYAVCLSETSFKREMKRLKIEEPVSFITPNAAATCHVFEKGDDTTIILCFDPADAKERTNSQVVGLVSHEASHAADFTLTAMGEDQPGTETRAYLVQWFTQCAYEALVKAAKKK